VKRGPGIWWGAGGGVTLRIWVDTDRVPVCSLSRQPWRRRCPTLGGSGRGCGVRRGPHGGRSSRWLTRCSAASGCPAREGDAAARVTVGFDGVVRRSAQHGRLPPPLRTSWAASPVYAGSLPHRNPVVGGRTPAVRSGSSVRGTRHSRRPRTAKAEFCPRPTRLRRSSTGETVLVWLLKAAAFT
jgi:hypothetical protein